MEPLENKILELEKKVDEMSLVVKKLYKIFLWTVILTVATLVLPLIGLVFAIPKFLATYSSLLGQ